MAEPDFDSLHANGSDTCDDLLPPELIESDSRVRHPDEVGDGWHPSPDFLDPLADELEEWLRDSESKGLDYTEPTTLDRLTYIIAGIVVDGPGSVPQAAAWWGARAWFDVKGPAGFGNRFAGKVEGVWDETESLERRIKAWVPNVDSPDEDDNEGRSSYGNSEFTGFLVTVVEPFLADLRNWSRELKLQFPPGRAPAGKTGQVEGAPSRVRKKRSTNKGDARTKIISALTTHHQYAKGGCLNLEPIGNNELARQAEVAPSTASDFFNNVFNKREKGGFPRYCVICRDARQLAFSLKALNGEFSPHDLYGERPPGEGERDDERDDEE
jgi:hypothetical protein